MGHRHHPSSLAPTLFLAVHAVLQARLLPLVVVVMNMSDIISTNIMLTSLKFLMDFSEGSFMTILIVGLIILSQYQTQHLLPNTNRQYNRHQKCACALLPQANYPRCRRQGRFVLRQPRAEEALRFPRRLPQPIFRGFLRWQHAYWSGYHDPLRS